MFSYQINIANATQQLFIISIILFTYRSFIKNLCMANVSPIGLAFQAVTLLWRRDVFVYHFQIDLVLGTVANKNPKK